MLKKYIHKHIDEFKRANDEFTVEYQKQKLMIRRFDEVLSLKASKLDLEEEVQMMDIK